MGALSELMSGDAVWAIQAAIILPSLGAIWWYLVTKTNHLYSKLSEVKEDLAIKNEQIARLKHDLKNHRMAVEWNAQKLVDRETDINYLYWHINKDINHEQSKQAKRPTDR